MLPWGTRKAYATGTPLVEARGASKHPTMIGPLRPPQNYPGQTVNSAEAEQPCFRPTSPSLGARNTVNQIMNAWARSSYLNKTDMHLREGRGEWILMDQPTRYTASSLSQRTRFIVYRFRVSFLLLCNKLPQIQCRKQPRLVTS